ncbi:MAG: hypothetical protein LBP26_08065 [Clostridiales bacterium]|jgi:hypothetical protein|nr:hypothetical protein [Clostridiales bacterium]
MISVTEIKDGGERLAALEYLGLKDDSRAAGARVFAARENDRMAAAGALRLIQAPARQPQIALAAEGSDSAVKNLIVRAMLNAVRDIKGAAVTTDDPDPLFLRLGFKKSNGAYSVITDKINFGASCKENDI